MTYYKWSKTAASNATADSTIDWAEGMAPSAVNDSSRAEMAAAAKARDDHAGSLTTGGTSTAYTLISNQVFDTLANMSGQKLKVRFNATNGAAPTLNVDSLGAKAIQTASGTAVATGAILADSVHDLTYDNSIPAWLLSGSFAKTTLLSDVNITGATAETSPAVADEIPLYDASAAANRKMTVANLLKVITLLTAETSPATDDELALYDTSGTATDKITLANLFKIINAFTEDTTPDLSSDFLASYDASATAAKKVALKNVGRMVLISAQTASSSATIDFDQSNSASAFDGTYDRLALFISSAKPASDDVEAWLRVGTGAGPTYQTSGYQYISNLIIVGTPNANPGGTAQAKIVVTSTDATAGVGNASGENLGATIWFCSPDASDLMNIDFKSFYTTAAGNAASADGVGVYATAGAVTAIRFLFESGNIASGRFALFGIKDT